MNKQILKPERIEHCWYQFARAYNTDHSLLGSHVRTYNYYFIQSAYINQALENTQWNAII